MKTTVELEHLSESRRLFEFATYVKTAPIDIIILFYGAEGYRNRKTNQLLAREETFLLRSWEDRSSDVERLQRRLKSRCAGLLEGTTKVDFLHQTAREFIIQQLQTGGIFQNYVGFDSSVNLEFAFSSSIIRRLKGWKEVIPRMDHDAGMGFDLEFLARCWKKDNFSKTGSRFIRRVLAIPSELELEPNVSIWLELIDELDITGKQLLSAWTQWFPEEFRRTRPENLYWTELFMRPSNDYEKKYRFPPPACSAEAIAPVLIRLAESYWSIKAYIDGKVKDGTLSGYHLERIFLDLAYSPGVRFESLGLGFNNNCSSELIEVLLNLGADPNAQHEVTQIHPTGDGRSAVVLRSPWKLLLERLKECGPQHLAHLHQLCISARLFVIHEADLQIHWSAWIMVKPTGFTEQKLSPGSIFAEKLNMLQAMKVDRKGVFFHKKCMQILEDLTDI